MKPREIKFRAWQDGEMIYQNPGKGPYKLVEFFSKIYADNYEVMQYTGLRDQDNTEIYEGDVDSLNRVVVFKNGAFMFEYPGQTNSADALHPDRCRFIEIIGNVHENPELIGQNVE